MLSTDAFHFLLMLRSSSFVKYLSAHSNMKPHSLCHALLLQEVYLWQLSLLRIFLLCIQLIPHPA